MKAYVPIFHRERERERERELENKEYEKTI
jgi:hypothetical protein